MFRSLLASSAAVVLVAASSAQTAAVGDSPTFTFNEPLLNGQGVTSLLCHLSRVEVREGDRVEARAPLGLSGSSGIAAAPHLHWGVYIHGVAVNPELLAKGLE